MKVLLACEAELRALLSIFSLSACCFWAAAKQDADAVSTAVVGVDSVSGGGGYQFRAFP